MGYINGWGQICDMHLTDFVNRVTLYLRIYHIVHSDGRANIYRLHILGSTNLLLCEL